MLVCLLRKSMRRAPTPRHRHQLVQHSSYSLCITLRAGGGNPVDAAQLPLASGVISWSRRNALRFPALEDCTTPPTSVSSTNTTACLQRSPPCPTGSSGHIYGRPTSTSSSIASCVFDVDSGCRRRNRRPSAGTGQAMPRSSWASPQNPSCAGQRPASCAASALAIGLTDTTPTRNC